MDKKILQIIVLLSLIVGFLIIIGTIAGGNLELKVDTEIRKMNEESKPVSPTPTTTTNNNNSEEKTTSETNNFDGKGTVKFFEPDELSSEIWFIEIENSKVLCVNSLFKDSISVGNTIYFNYTGNSFDNGVDTFPIIIPVNSDGSSMN